MPPKSEPINISNWATQLRKGILELAIINIVAQGDIYGYDLVKRLASVKGLVVTEGTIYPLLARLKAAGILTTYLQESDAGPARKYYSLTGEGRNMAAMMNRHWDQLITGVTELAKGAKR